MMAKKLKEMVKKNQKKTKKNQKQDIDMLTVIDRVGQNLFESGQITRANLQLLNRITESRRERRSINDHIKELSDMKEKHRKKSYHLPDLKGNQANIQYKLKLNPDYRTPKEHRMTIYEQYWQVLKTRRNLYNIKLEFNTKLKKLRTEKFNILREFQILKRDLNYMSQECRVDDIILPRTPNFNTELEFPEKLFMNKPPHCILDDPIPPISQELEEERKNLYGNHHSNFHEIYNEAENMNKYINYTWTPGILSYEDHSTLVKIFPVHPWRADMIHRRNMKFRERVKAKSLSLINRIQEYDKSLKHLSYERNEYEKKIIKIKLELNYLIQELEITRGFSALEISVKSRASEMIKMKHVTLLQMSVKKKKIEQNNLIIEKSQAISNTILNQFLEVVKENKYVKHLTRVFKKKYKAPKIRYEDESSSSSSFDDDFDDDVEGDDLQMTIGGAYLFDEKIRPEDCDPDIFEKTFSLRAERHVEEAKVNQARNENQLFIKDLETLRKKLLMIETILAIFNSQMDSFLKCKQDACNKIWKVVVLKPSQIQHYNKYTKSFPLLNQCVLISSSTIRRLISKAEQLEKETQTFNKEKEKCKDHIVRLRKDIVYMKSQCQDLRNEKKDEMMKKFGMQVNMGHLEEVISSWIIQDAQQNNVVDHIRNYMKDVSVRRQQRQLLEAKKDQTNQYHELFSIQEERNKITLQILNMKNTKKELTSRHNKRRLDLESYLEELEKEVICQMAYKEYLLNQISVLKFKQQPHLLSKAEKKPFQQKVNTSSISTSAAMQNIVSDIVRNVISSVSEVETPTEDYQEEEGLEEVSTEESGNCPESKGEEELNTSRFAVEIIKDVIKGVLPSTDEIKAEELPDRFQTAEMPTGSNQLLTVLHQRSEDQVQQPTGSEISMSEIQEIAAENEEPFIMEPSPKQEVGQDEATISTYKRDSETQVSLEQSISIPQDENDKSGKQSQPESKK